MLFLFDIKKACWNGRLYGGVCVVLHMHTLFFRGCINGKHSSRLSNPSQCNCNIALCRWLDFSRKCFSLNNACCTASGVHALPVADNNRSPFMCTAISLSLWLTFNADSRPWITDKYHESLCLHRTSYCCLSIKINSFCYVYFYYPTKNCAIIGGVQNYLHRLS